jgi:hypothetical protein
MRARPPLPWTGAGSVKVRCRSAWLLHFAAAPPIRLVLRERVLGPDHSSTLVSRNNLGLAYQPAGRAAEAIPLHEQTLANRERVLGPDHPRAQQSRKAA